MKYGLSDAVIEKLCGVLAQFPEVKRAVLYGSRAKGNYKVGSDIDLTLFGEAITPPRCATIADAMDELLLPYTIDLSVFSDLDNADLREHIERVGLVFYQRSN
jgi:uncharacterized protein